jgi:hypothetical protein
MTARKLPLTEDHTDFLLRLETILKGSRVLSVSYVPLEVDHKARRSWSSSVVHEIDLDVVIVLDSCTVRIAWARDDLVEGLAVTIEDEADPADPLLPPAVVVDLLLPWKPIVGSVIAAVGTGWQQNEESCSLSLWSIRLTTTDGRNVVIALGELDERLEELAYHPDALLVIFNEATARSYDTLTSFGSAWGSIGLP